MRTTAFRCGFQACICQYKEVFLEAIKVSPPSKTIVTNTRNSYLLFGTLTRKSVKQKVFDNVSNVEKKLTRRPKKVLCPVFFFKKIVWLPEPAPAVNLNSV